MKLTQIAHCVALMSVAGLAAAQTIKTNALERVEVTGSSIKRVQAEGALPIEVITLEDMERRGLSSVEDLLKSLSGSATGSDSAVSNNNILAEILTDSQGALPMRTCAVLGRAPHWFS